MLVKPLTALRTATPGWRRVTFVVLNGVENALGKVDVSSADSRMIAVPKVGRV
jgi:hypothetical protein